MGYTKVCPAFLSTSDTRYIATSVARRTVWCYLPKCCHLNFTLHLRSPLFVYTGRSSCPYARQPYRLEGLHPPGHSQRAAALGKPGHCALQHVFMFQLSRRSASVCINLCRAIRACPVQTRKPFEADLPIHLLCIVCPIGKVPGQPPSVHKGIFSKSNTYLT
jgi:hypothetical protein